MTRMLLLSTFSLRTSSCLTGLPPLWFLDHAHGGDRGRDPGDLLRRRLLALGNQFEEEEIMHLPATSISICSLIVAECCVLWVLQLFVSL